MAESTTRDVTFRAKFVVDEQSKTTVLQASAAVTKSYQDQAAAAIAAANAVSKAYHDQAAAARAAVSAASAASQGGAGAPALTGAGRAGEERRVVQEVDRAAQETVRITETAEKDRSDAAKESANERISEERRAQEAAEKAEREKAAATEKAEQDRARAAKEAAEERAKAEKAAEKAAADHQARVAKLRQEHDRQQESVAKANKTAVEGYKQVLEGVMALGRSVLALNIANEKNIESATRVFARFVSVGEAIKGTINIVEGGIKIWQGYRAAVEAAAAAEAARVGLAGLGDAGGAARAGSAAVRGAAAESAVGTVLGAGGGALASRAAFGGGATAAAGTTAAAGGTAASGGAMSSLAAGAAWLGPLVAIAGAITLAIGGVAAIISKDFRAALLEFIGWTNKGADALKKADRKAAEADRRIGLETGRYMADQERGRAEFNARLGGIYGNTREANAERGVLIGREAREAREQRQAIEQGSLGSANVNYYEALSAARQREADALEKMKQINEETLDIGRRGYDEQIQAAQQILDTRKQELDVAKRAAEVEAGRVRSAEERLAGMTPDQAAAIKQAAEKAQRGEQLSYQESQRLKGLPGYEQQVADAERRRVTELGLDGVLDPARQAAKDAQARAVSLEASVKVQNEVVVKLAADRAEFEAEMQAAIGAIYKRTEEAIIAAMEANAQKMARELALKFSGQGKVN